MNRFFKMLAVGLLAAIGMATAVSAAQALTISTSAQTTTATIRGLTLTDSALGNVLGNVTLTLNIRATSSSTFPVTAGTVTAGAVTITSPAGVTASTDTSTPWNVVVTGLSGSGLAVTIQSPRFSLFGTPAGTVVYSGGSVQGTIGASPAGSYTITGSSIPSSIGTTGSFARGSLWTLSPALTYTVV